jgi:lactoylglutathione lyase
MSVTAFDFTKILVGDLAAAERFYVGALRFTVVTRLAHGDGERALEEVILLPAGAERTSTQLVIKRYVNRPAPAPGEAILGFHVDDIEATIAAALAYGGSIDHPPVDVPDHALRVAYVKDHEGHLIELLQSVAQAATD